MFIKVSCVKKKKKSSYAKIYKNFARANKNAK